MFTRSRASALALLLIAAIVSTGCSTNSSEGSPSTSSDGVPHGWKTYTYGKAQISVPSSWSVTKNYVCTGLNTTGTLYLGPPTGTAFCPLDIKQGGSVTVTSLPGGINGDSPACKLRSHELLVYVGPCSTSDAAGIVYFDVPSLGVRALGHGTYNQNVTDPEAKTVVDQVLRSIRRR